MSTDVTSPPSGTTRAAPEKDGTFGLSGVGDTSVTSVRRHIGGTAVVPVDATAVR